MTNPAAPQVFVRPRPRDLGDIPLDTSVALHARLTLKPRELGAWFNLRTHLWIAGDLPVGVRALARIAGVGPASFEKMMPYLHPLFDHGDDGRWHDVDLEDERERRLHLSPEESRALAFEPPKRNVSPELSAKRSLNGAKGGRMSAERRRYQLIQGGRAADDGEANEAKIEANGQANAGDLPAGFAASLPSVASPHTVGLSVSLLETDSKNEEQTDQQTSKPAGAARASTEAKPPANVEAKPDDGAQAKPQAKGTTEQDGRIVRAIVTACTGPSGAKVDEKHVYFRLSEIREAIAKGCSLEDDIVPACRDFATTNTHVRNCFNQHVRAKAFELRDYRLRNGFGQTQGVAETSKVFVAKGSRQWDAWLVHKGARSLPTKARSSADPTPGWSFPSEWPPGHPGG